MMTVRACRIQEHSDRPGRCVVTYSTVQGAIIDADSRNIFGISARVVRVISESGEVAFGVMVRWKTA